MPAKPLDAPTSRVRDAQATRQKLLAAATAAFATSGFAGVRVDQLAREAGVNKALIYHHFGDKQGLYEAVVTATNTPLEAPPDLSSLGEWQAALAQGLDADQVRLMAWEGLRLGAAISGDALDADLTVAEAENPSSQTGRSARSIQDTQDLALLFLALAAFPRLCPQSVTQLTGTKPDSAAFETRWQRLQERLLRLIQNAARSRKERVTLRPQTQRSGD